MNKSELRRLNALGKQILADKPETALILGRLGRALEEVCYIGSYGNGKHRNPDGSSGDGNWEDKGEAYFMNKALRHFFKHADGELRCPESGMLHLAHMAWNVLACLQAHHTDSWESTKGDNKC